MQLTQQLTRLARVGVAVALLLGLGAGTTLAAAIVDGPPPVITLLAKVDPVVTLEMQDVDNEPLTTAYLGMDIHAFVVVSGRAGVPTGTVKVYQWNGGICSGSASVVGPYTLATGQIQTPYQWPMNTLGTFAFRVTYQGDANYNAVSSSCHVIQVTKWPVAFDTVLHDQYEHVVTWTYVGNIVHAAATLSGQLGTPVGMVSVKHYLTGDCTGSPNFDVSITAAAVMDPAGPSLYNNEGPGGYSWRLAYLGNDLYAAATSPCLTLHRYSSPTITVTVHNPGHDAITKLTLGKTAHLSMVATGPFGTPTGNVTAKWYANGTCTGTTKTLGTRTFANGLIDDATLKFTPSKIGTYSFMATYPGDDAYRSNTSNCATLKVVAAPVVTPAPTTPPTTPPATPQPTEVVALPTSTPAATDVPVATDAPAPSATPDATVAIPTAGASGASGSPEATEGSGPVDPTTSSGDGGSGTGWILLLGLILLLVLGGGYVYSRRTKEPKKA